MMERRGEQNIKNVITKLSECGGIFEGGKSKFVVKKITGPI